MPRKTIGSDIPYPTNGHLWVADLTRFPTYPTACEVANVPDIALPEIPSYVCQRVEEPIVIDGRLNEEVWSRAQWSSSFAAIESGLTDGRETTVALLWDD